jgi:glycosyltransferase involved in cell wall biosynthesis
MGKNPSLARHQASVFVLSNAAALGGLERLTVNLTRGFTQYGYDGSCLIPQTVISEQILKWCREQGVEAEVNAAWLFLPEPHTLASINHLRSMLAARRPIAVSLHYPGKIPLKDVLAVRLAGIRRCVVTIHEVPSKSLSSRQRLMMKLSSWLLNGIIVHSHAIAEELIAAGVPARKVIYTPPGLHFSENVPAKASARLRLDMPASAFIIGVHARFDPRKGLAELIETVGSLPVEADGPYLLIARDGPQREELTALAKAHLGTRARLLGQLDEAALADFYAALDVFALAPVLPEGFGLVYVEAAQYGMPSVGWRIGGARDAVLDGETGLLVESPNRAELEQALTQLRTDLALRERLGTAAQTRAFTEFNEMRMVDVYARALHLKPVRSPSPLRAKELVK